MKVLMQNRYPHMWIGGDQIQLESALQALCAIGLQVDFNAEPMPDLQRYDIVHLFNLSAGWTFFQARSAHRQAKPYVVSTIYQDTTKSVPYQKQQEIVDNAAKVICNSWGEVARLRKRLFVPDEKVAVVPFGVDPDFQGKKVHPFHLPSGAEYVLSVGRINDKNQIRLASVCRQLDIPLVLVGEARDQEVLARLDEVGHHHCFYLGPKTQEDLIPVYKGARVVACVSPAEVFPSVVLEGGLAGCHIVLTKGSASMTDWPNVELCDPESPQDIARALTKQMKAPRNSLLVEKVREYTWPKVAERLASVYAEVTANGKKVTPIGSPELEPILDRFSSAQKRSALHLSFLLPAWAAYYTGEVALGHEILERYFRSGIDRPSLDYFFVRSLSLYAHRYVHTTSPFRDAKQFIHYVFKSLPASLSDVRPLQSNTLAWSLAYSALQQWAEGRKLKAVAQGGVAIIRDPIRLLRMISAETLGTISR